MQKNNSGLSGELKVNIQSKTPSLRASKTMRQGVKNQKTLMGTDEKEHENDESSSDNESELANR